MINKLVYFFFALILSANLSAQDCSIDLSLGVILGNSQSYCAPFELTLIVDAPENPPETEYMFVLHDSGPLPHSTTDTLIYNQSEISNSVVFNLESSTCDASGMGYIVEVYIIDNCEEPISIPIALFEGITIDGAPTADFSYSHSCNVYTFSNSSISGEAVVEGLCESVEEHIYWLIDAETNDYTILSGTLGSDVVTNEGSETLTVEFFESGNVEVSIVASTCAADTMTDVICIENINPQIEFNIPETVCVDEPIILQNDIQELFFCNPDFGWTLELISSLECTFNDFDDYSFINGTSNLSFEPNLLIHNPGLYEAHLISLPTSCVSVDTTFTIEVKGYPQIQNLTYSQVCNSFQIDLAVDYDSCLTPSPINFLWNIQDNHDVVYEQTDSISVIFENIGDYPIEYTLSSECGEDTEIINVSVVDTLSINLGNDTIICFGSSLELTPYISGGKEPYTFNLIDDVSLDNIETGLEVILQVTDFNDCTAMDTLFVDVQSLAEFVLDSLYTMCAGDTLTISPEYLFDLESYTILWQETIESPELTYFGDESMQVHLSIIDSLGCIYNDTTFIQFDSIPHFDLDTFIFCSGEEMILDTEHENGIWTGEHVDFDIISGQFYFDDNEDSAPENEIYYSVENESGCIALDTTLVIVNSNPNVGISGADSNSYCSSESTIILLNDTIYTNAITTQYTITVFQGDGNPEFETFAFSQEDLPNPLIFPMSENVPTSSCDFEYTNPFYNGAYVYRIEVSNDCANLIPSTANLLLYFGGESISNFIIDSTSACADSIYTFVNESTGETNSYGTCSPPEIIWQVSGEEGIDWNVVSGQLGDSIISGSDLLDVQFTNSGDYEIQLISTTCTSDTISKFICVESTLNPLISVPDTTCINTELAIANNTDITKTCSIEYLWTVTQMSSFCSQDANSDYTLTNNQSSIPNIIINNPGEYLITCEMSNDCDTYITKDTVLSLSPPEVTFVDINQLDICNPGHISLELETDSCSTDLLNYLWQVDNATIIQSDSIEIEVIFDNYGANQILFTTENQCGTDNFDYTFNYEAPAIDEFGPALTFCNQNIPQPLNDPYGGEWDGPFVNTLANGTPVFTPSIEGVFTAIYTYTDENGCEQQESIQINVIPLTEIEITQTVETAVDVPIGFSVSPVGGNFTYPDNVIITGNEISANEDGEYVIYYEVGTNSCYTLDSLLLIVNPLPEIVINDTIICYGDTVLLSPQILSVQQPYTQFWNTAQTSQNIEVSPDVTTTYTYTVTDAYGGQSTVNTVVEVLCSYVNFDQFESNHITNETEVLFPNNTDYENVLFEGCTGATITFYKPECTVGDISFSYKLDGNAIEYEDFTRFPSSDSLTILSDEDSITIEIFVNNDFINESPDSIIFTIDQIVYSPCYSSSQDTLLFLIHDQPELSLNLTSDFSVYCPGDDALLEVEAFGGVGSLLQQPYVVEPYLYEWSHIGTLASQTVNPIETTEYCVEVIDVCSSKVEDCVFVTVPIYPDLEIESEFKYICEDTLEQICVFVVGGEGNYTYEWSNGTIEDCIEDYHGIYNVTVVDGCGVEQSTNGQIYLDEAPEPFFEYLPIPHENFGIEFNNYTPNLSEVSNAWNFGDGSQNTNIFHANPLHVYSESGNYPVSLTVTTNLYGCYKEVTYLVSVEPNFHLYIPNTFTPNNDGVNDGFKPIISGHDYFEFYVYDRWGEQIFHTKNSDDLWYGNNEGELCPIGTYVCKVIYSKQNDIMNLTDYTSINLVR